MDNKIIGKLDGRMANSIVEAHRTLLDVRDSDYRDTHIRKAITSKTISTLKSDKFS